jgi:hypothetical protein
MFVTVELSAELLGRLRREAARRGVSIDAVIADFAARLPSADGTPRHRLSFIGIGSSGRPEPMDIRRERAELAAKLLVDPNLMVAAACPVGDPPGRCARQLGDADCGAPSTLKVWP